MDITCGILYVVNTVCITLNSSVNIEHSLHTRYHLVAMVM